MNELAVVVPAYNEGTRIYRNLKEIVTQTEKFCDDFMIIAVNDGSSDETETEIKRAAKTDSRIKYISYSKNRGKGYAVRRGLLASSAKYMAFLDADLELPPYLIGNFLTEMKKSEQGQPIDIVIGSKMHKDSQLKYPFIRKVFSFGYYVLLKLLFGLKLKDTQTGVKLFRSETVRPIVRDMHVTSFSFDVELLAIAAKRGLSISEMPVIVNFSRNKTDRSKITFKSIYTMFFDTVRTWLRVRKIK